MPETSKHEASKSDAHNTSKKSDGKSNKASHAMWGGRFGGGPDAIMAEINASIDVDQRLFREDIAGSRAHAQMLGKTGILTESDVTAILSGLDQIEGEIERGEMAFEPALEDIHMHVEARLRELIGDAGARLHTGRSRNDQVATDFRLYLRRTAEEISEQIQELMAALAHQAKVHHALVMPGFTHLQTAQPVTLGHHLLAYVEMLSRDCERLADATERMNECPLGAAALAGTSFPLDRDMTAEALGFDRPMANSLDAVSARDFALELLSVLTILGVHLSRLSEEIVIFASQPFGFLTLSDGFSTGSSIMPQKRNPDAAELIRAKVGKMAGAFTQLTLVLKGLPLAYSKDMQEDKATVFGAFDDMSLCLAAMTGMINDLKPNADTMKEAAEGGFSTATDLADWLVRVAGLPFRDAHHVTGSIVKLAEDDGLRLDQLSLSAMQQVDGRITADIFSVLSVDASVSSRTSYGGTSPANVLDQATDWLIELGEEENEFGDQADDD